METDSYICKEKEMICSCDLADCLSDHVHKNHGEGNGKPTPVLLPEKSHG